MNLIHFPTTSMVRYRAHLLVVLCAALVITSCQTIPKAEDIPANFSPAKFIQKAQESIDAEQYDAALFYLDEFRKRFGVSTGPAILDKLMEADYIAAQITYKRGKLPEARAMYEALLKQYDGVPNDAASPPRWIKILSTKLIATIDQKLAAKALAASPTPSSAPESSASPAGVSAAPAEASATPAAASASPAPSPTPSPTS